MYTMNWPVKTQGPNRHTSYRTKVRFSIQNTSNGPLALHSDIQGMSTIMDIDVTAMTEIYGLYCEW